MLQSITSGLYAYTGIIVSNNIAAFDLDWTLVREIRGRFPKDENDFAFLPNRIRVLKFYIENKYTIAIFTNQGYTGANLTRAINRINNILKVLLGEGINPWILAATGKNSSYRKPNIGMWQVFSQYIPNLDLTKSFYVGDAAGRPQDHNSTDREFANNIGLPFYTPEQIFPTNQITIPDTQTMFIFVGMPGSGKSTYYEQNLAPKGWVHANQDILKTQAKMISTVRSALASGKSVAVDATNPSFDKRKEYLMLAVQYQVPVLIIYFVRNGYGWNKLRSKPVPDIAYNMYFKNLVEPNSSIDSVPVVEIS